MDQHSLLRLANTGLASLPPSRLGDYASWCWDFGEASAKPQYLMLSRVFNELAEAFGQFEAVGNDLVGSVDTALAELLPLFVLNREHLAAGAVKILATLRQQLWHGQAVVGSLQTVPFPSEVP